MQIPVIRRDFIFYPSIYSYGIWPETNNIMSLEKQILLCAYHDRFNRKKSIYQNCIHF